MGNFLQPPSVNPLAVSGTQKGSASYSFSIPLPKFFIDFPLTLSYDSGGANAPGGEFGTGWSLSLPEVKRDITRDLLYFNGQLLVHTSKTGDYYEYHTVVENHQRILFHAREGRWEITSPDGTKMILADAATYPYAGEQYVERWRISSIRTPLGHEIQFKYRSDYPSTSGCCYPYLSEISYLPLGKDPYPVATFGEPVPKDGNELAYLNTHLMPITHRIGGLTVKRGDPLRSRYEFQYRQSQVLSRSQLWKIREFGTDDAISRDTVFDYGPPLAVSLGEPFARNYIYRNGDARITFHHTGDFNLNGTQDYLALESAGNITLVDGSKACPGVNPCTIPEEKWFSVGGHWDGKNGLTRVGDINGDGLLDFILITSDKYSMGDPWVSRMKKIYFGISKGDKINTPMMDAFPNRQIDWYINDDGSKSDDFFFMDLDGDGRTDLVWITSQLGKNHQWARNTHAQDQFFTVNRTPFEEFKTIQGLAWVPGHMHAGDFNGDGLVDFYEDSSKVIYLNQRGSFIKKTWGNLSMPSSGVAVGDVNRDGLDDLVFIGSKSTGQGCEYSISVAQSTGTGFNSFAPLGSKTIADPLFASWCDIPSNLSLQDVDGDGDLDFVITYDRNGLTQVIIPNTSADALVNQDLLEKITLPTKGSLSLEYVAAKNEWNTNLSSGIRPWRLGSLGFRPVLWKILMEDQIGNGTWIDYEYENGYYDVVSKEFRGFQRVTKTFPPHPKDFHEDFPNVDVFSHFGDGLKEFSSYHVWNQNYYKVYDGLAGKIYWEEFRGEDRSSYLHREYLYDSSQNPQTGVFTTHLREKKIYPCSDGSGGGCEVASTEYKWTNYGAIKHVYYYGFHYSVEKQAKSSEVYEYAENVGSYIVNKPYEKRIHKGILGDLLVKESYGYDDKDVGVPPAQGKLTKKIVEDATVKGKLLMGASEITTTQYEHDAYGNVKKETSPEGKVTWWDYAQNAYLFPYTKTLNVGKRTLTTTTLYDLAKDRLSTETDPNGHKTEYRYDRFGRIEKIIRPGDSEASPSQSYYYQELSVPNYVQKTIKGNDQKSTIERTYMDGLGRFKGKVAGKGVLGPYDTLWVQSQVTTYTVNGPKKWVYEPFVTTSPALVTAPDAPYTFYVYLDNRVTAVHHPDGNKTRYYHLRDGVRITDERNIHTFQYHDAFGNIIKVKEDTDTWGEGKEETRVTDYQYDELNHLVQSKDPRGLITEYQYDAFGRIRGANSPDTNYS
jgi:YD repeat-containing protein